jgi:mono/diheme cytochrome c family protein
MSTRIFTWMSAGLLLGLASAHIGLAQNSAVTATLTPTSGPVQLADGDGRSLHDSGEVRQGGNLIGYYTRSSRVSTGVALGTATISITAHLIGQSPPQNLTIEGVQDPTTGAATGSVSAASSGLRSLIGANVTISRTGNQDSVTLSLPGGDPAVGQQIWLTKGCGSCHSLGTFDTVAEFPGAPDLAGKGALLRNDMGTISPVMQGVMLTDQQIIDLAAFLDSF